MFTQPTEAACFFFFTPAHGPEMRLPSLLLISAAYGQYNAGHSEHSLPLVVSNSTSERSIAVSELY